MNVPKLRFREFGGEWEEKKLGQVTTYVDYRGRAPIKTEEGHFLVTAKNIKKGFIDYECSKEYVAENDYLNVMSKGLPEVGDVLFTTEAPMGNVAQVDNKNIALAQRVIKFRGKQMLSNSYLLYYMLSFVFQNLISKKSIGTTVQGISGKELHKVKLSFPSKPEQEKIASFLSSVETKIEQLTKKKTLLEEYKKGVMQKIFAQEIRFRDDDGSEYPEWVEKKLGDTLDIVVDNRGKTPPVSEFGIPLIEVNAIGNKEINYLKVSKYVTEETYKEWFRKYLKDGDILFSTVGQTAVCSLYDESVKAVIAQNIVGLRFFNEYSLFMYYLLTETKNHHKFKRIEMGAVQPSVKVSQMVHIDFLIPTLKEQTKIANFLSSIDSKLSHVEQQLNSTKEFKKALLQQMFV